MQSIYVPQSKLSQIKAHLNSFNKELHANGLEKVVFSVGKPLVREWFVTERKWDDNLKSWVDEGVKKSVKLHKIEFDYEFLHIENMIPLAYFNGSAAVFDDLLNEVVTCPSISFDNTLISNDLLKSVF